MTGHSGRIAVRRLALLVAIAVSPLPAGESSSTSVQVRWRGAPVALAPDSLAAIARKVEQLARGALYADRSTPPDTPRELEILIHYDPPLSLELPLREPALASVRSITLFTTAVDKDGWPALFAFTDEGSWYLAKYSGPHLLDLFCSPELEAYTSAAFRSKCAPTRSRHPPGGSSNHRPRCP